MAVQRPICISLDDGFWNNLILDEGLSDTKLVVTDKDDKVIWEFNVHSIVLRRRSKVFKKRITEAGQTITFKNINLLVLKKFIKYLYVGDIYVESSEEIVQFLEIALEYGVDGLYSELEFSLQKYVDLLTACDLLEIAVRFDLKKLEEKCLKTITRGAVIVFGTSGFLRLSSETLQLIIKDPRLNIVREVDVILYLICWAKADAFSKGKKLDNEGLYNKIKPILDTVRFDKITVADQQMVPDSIRSLVFPGAAFYSAQESSLSLVRADPKPALKPRVASTGDCILSNFAELLLRDSNSSISWVDMGWGSNLVLRFSVTMPIFLGGFLAVYRHQNRYSYAIMTVVIRPSPKESGEPAPNASYTFTSRVCEHTAKNEIVHRENYQCQCYEPVTPILMASGDECNVYLQMPHNTNIDQNAHHAPRINYPFTTIKTPEGPTVRMHMDSVTAIRKIHFLSACGRCIVTPRD